MRLNREQQAAVDYLDGPLLVLAGAGSGKTRVITAKIAHLIATQHTAARHIAAVTFTNKAAREMRDRLKQQLGAEAQRLRVSTFHTLGLDILRHQPQAVDLKANFSIFDARDTLQVLRELSSSEGSRLEHQQWSISRWKNALVAPDQALDQATDEDTSATARLYASYTRQLRAYNAVDFDDLILLPWQAFRGHPELLAQWQRRIRYLLVDEYQDTNACQYQLVRQLVGDSGALTAVGDDDQSIYAWRGAQPQNLRLLQTDFPRLKLIKLEQNYRSAQPILVAANAVIANNPRLVDKRLWSHIPAREPIRILECDTDEMEIERVLQDLIRHKLQHHGSYGDYAILYRSNHQGQAFEPILRQKNLPYRLSGGQSLFDHAEVKDLMAYLRLLVNPDDDAAFIRVVNVPRREIGPQTLEKLAQYANQRQISLLAACFEYGVLTHLGESAAQKLGQFAEFVVRYGERAERGDTNAAIRDAINAIDYRGWVVDQARDKRTGEKRLKRVDALVDWLERLATDLPSLAERVARLTLVDLLQRQEEAREDAAISLMTLHAAKGLEFPQVYLVGVEEDNLPHRNSLEGDAAPSETTGHGLEEERRLFYVGITRAKFGLTMTYAKQRKRYGELVDCEPSRFLDELPADICREGQNAPSVDHQALGRSVLANLKAKLAARNENPS